MPHHEVVIAGAGPTGLMLAGELALAGIDVAVVEQRPSEIRAGSRAGGLHARSLEVFDMRGIAGRFLSEGQAADSVSFGGARLSIADFPTRHNYVLGLWQNHIERILAEWVRELGATIEYGCEVTNFEQDSSGVSVHLTDGVSLRSEYLVGCDGGRSRVRKGSDIDFPGWEATTSSLLAEVEMAEAPKLGMRRDALGQHGIGRVNYTIQDGTIVYADSGPFRVMLTEREVGGQTEPTLTDLREGLITVFGSDYGVHSPTWITRFTDMARQAAAYRNGRVLLAGDAAHVHPPDGGMGLNTGVQDAVNLGWKLAQVIKGVSPASLLDTYHIERHPVAARVLRTAMAAALLRRPEGRTEALRATMADLLRFDEPRKNLAAEISALGIRYDLGDGHALLGRRIPDLELVMPNGAMRVFELMHEGRPVLINFGTVGTLQSGTRGDRLLRVDAEYRGKWELPALGAVSAPSAVLIRPDGYVAWVGEGTRDGLDEALGMWYGGGVTEG